MSQLINYSSGGGTGTVTSVTANTNLTDSGTATDPIINLDATITLTRVNATSFYTNVAEANIKISDTTIEVVGTDANINLSLVTKGDGFVNIDLLSLDTPLGVASGGTGTNTLTQNGILYGNAANNVGITAELSDGKLLIGSTGNPPVLATLTGSDYIDITSVAGSITIEGSTAIDSFSGFDDWDGGAPYFDDTVLGTFTLSQSGYGFIEGVVVGWTAPQSVTGMTAGNTYFIYIDSAGDIQKTTTDNLALYQDNIVLFECMRDSTAGTNNQVTVKENHSYKMPQITSNYLHRSIGTVISNHNGGANIVLNGTKKIQINGADELLDHGLTTTISDSSGVGVSWYKYYTNGSGKWALQNSTDEFSGYYNNAGTPTVLGGSKYGVYRLYVSKDDINTAIPLYIAIMNTAQYNNLAAAETAIANGDISMDSGELEELELARLGYIIFGQAADAILEVFIAKETVSSGTTTSGTNTASLVLTSFTNFDGVLSTADTNVQAALETIDEWGKTTTDHALLVGNGTGSPIGSLSVGGAGTILTGVLSDDPTWTTATYPATVAIGDVLIASAANVISAVTGAVTSGYILTANGAGNAPTFQTNAGGTGIGTLAGDTGTATGATVTIAGGGNIITSGATDTITVDTVANLTDLTSIMMDDTGSIQTTTTDTDTMLIQGYDVDGTAYVPFITITNANDPTCDLNTGVTIGTKYVYRADGTDIPIADGGTGASTLTDGGILLGSGTSAVTVTAQPTNGQLLIGHTSADPDLATLTGEHGIEVTNAAGSISIGNLLTLNAQTGTSYTTVIGDQNKFITMTNASASTLTIPKNDTVDYDIGSVIYVQQLGAGQVTLTPAADVVFRSADDAYKLVKQYSGAAIVKIAANTFSIFGDVEA